MIQELRIDRLSGRRVILTRDETGWTLHAHGLRVHAQSIGGCFAAALGEADRPAASAIMQGLFFEKSKGHNARVNP